MAVRLVSQLASCCLSRRTATTPIRNATGTRPPTTKLPMIRREQKWHMQPGKRWPREQRGASSRRIQVGLSSPRSVLCVRRFIWASMSSGHAQPVVYGPLLTAQENAPLNTSSQDLLNLISHPSSAPSTRLPIFIDVRDLAVAHIRALQRPGSIGKRIPLAGGTLWLDEAVDYLRTERPAVASRLPPASEGPLEKDTKTLARYDISLARDVLGIEAWMDWRQCLLDAVDSLLQREAASST